MPVTFEQGVELTDVVLVGVIKEVSANLVWNRLDDRPWTPGEYAGSRTPPESWPVLTIRVREILKTNRELVVEEFIGVRSPDTTPGFRRVSSTFQGSVVLVGAYEREAVMRTNPLLPP